MEGIINEFSRAEVEKLIIKVIGVGGGGGNAVNYMYKQGVSGVSYMICNTDEQALRKSPITTQVLLGEGLGAGNRPEVAHREAEEAEEAIRRELSDGTKMVFITAGMGGGTGTGAAPVVARIAKSMNILTVGIVTIPFAFEGNKKIFQALDGIARMSKSVDALLVINNEILLQIYADLDLPNAFDKVDNVVTSAAMGISEIVNVDGYINVDFADVSTIMRKGGMAIMNYGFASGERRITRAIEDALDSPLLNNNDIYSTNRILLNFYCSSEYQIKMAELAEIKEFMAKMGDDREVIWGITFDETLGEEVKITLIATGSDISMIPEEYKNRMLGKDDEENEELSFDKTDTQELEDARRKWAGALYPDENIVGEAPSLTMEMINTDPNLLQLLEEETAYSRLMSRNK